jgi:hypothetical protein
LLHHEASRARVFQFASKLMEEGRWVVHVASSRRLREDESKDVMGCIRLFYPYFAVFIVFGPRGIFSLFDEPIKRTLGAWGSLPLLLAFICIS